MENSDFVTFLDGYKDKSQVSPRDYLEIIQTINQNYLVNNLGSPLFCAHYVPTDGDVYKLWQENHTVEIQMDLNTEVEIKMDEKQKEVKVICVNITSFDDLIKLIENNEYDEQYDYNIDLKSLHIIKDDLVDLNNMIGMTRVKESLLDQLLYFLQGLHKGPRGDYKHTVIYGPPGTGKTEVAKIIGKMYSKVGILTNNVFKKVTRSDLIAGYLGQTAIKTKKVIDSCKGGVLFIDEVYALGSNSGNDDYSRECIDTICEALSEYKDDLMVIIAGYKEEIDDRFFQVNCGLESRFIWKFNMDKYTAKELFEIFKNIVTNCEWNIDESVTNEWFNKNHKKFVSLGRDMELLFTFSKICYGRRMYGNQNVENKILNINDVEKGFNIFNENKNRSNNEISNYLLNSIYL